MAKNNKEIINKGTSKWDGGLISSIGTILLAVLPVIIFTVLGIVAAIGIGAFKEPVAWFVGEKFNFMLLLGVVVIALFAMIGLSWALVIFMKWDIRHQVICGQRLKFQANTFILFFTMLKWVFLTVITVGIYGLWILVKFRKWQAAHIVSYPDEEEKEEESYWDEGDEPVITFYTVDD